jgi:hypothetical protein
MSVTRIIVVTTIVIEFRRRAVLGQQVIERGCP